MGMCNLLIAQPPAGAQLRPLPVDQSGAVTPTRGQCPSHRGSCVRGTCRPNEFNIVQQTREQEKCFTLLIESMMTITLRLVPFNRAAKRVQQC